MKQTEMKKKEENWIKEKEMITQNQKEKEKNLKKRKK